MGEVIKFPTPEPSAPGPSSRPNSRPSNRPRSCHHCQNAAFSVNGTYCLAFQETIHSERTAALDCPYYDEDESGERPMLIPHG